MRKRLRSKVLMEKLIPHAHERYRALWEIPGNHQSIGIISCDCEDVMHTALDDATKKARIRVLRDETVYGGYRYAWSRYGGEVTAIISGEKVADVKSGLAYIRTYVENRAGIYVFNEEETLGMYVDLIAHAGKYYQERLGVKEGDSLAYLVSTPIEATYGLDKALKASDTKIAHLMDAPTRVNTGGAILVGTEAACKSAVAAFGNAVEYCVHHPMQAE